jgi:hypothetical protein
MVRTIFAMLGLGALGHDRIGRSLAPVALRVTNLAPLRASW